jgi:iron complex transport system permease protein
MVGGLTVLLLAVLAARVLLGDFTVTVPDLVRILSGELIPGASYIVMEIKLPRALLALMVGLAFGVAGAIFQATLRNPLASPDIVGVSIGASAAAVFAIVILDLAGLPVSAAAVTGAVLVALLVRWAAGGRVRGSAYRLVLVGVGTAAALHSVIQYLFTRADVHDAQLTLRWLAGSVSAADWPTVRLLALLLLAASPLLLLVARSLPVIELGAEAAAALGVPRRRTDLVLLTAVALVAVAVAAAGPVSFVAFLAGPIARALNDGRTTLAGAGLVGAVVVLGADYAADYLLPGGNYPVGVVTGAIGAPFLLWLLARSRTGRTER